MCRQMQETAAFYSDSYIFIVYHYPCVHMFSNANLEVKSRSKVVATLM